MHGRESTASPPPDQQVMCADAEALYYRQGAEGLVLQGLQACLGELPGLPVPVLPGAVNVVGAPHAGPIVTSRWTAVEAHSCCQDQMLCKGGCASTLHHTAGEA